MGRARRKACARLVANPASYRRSFDYFQRRTQESPNHFRHRRKTRVRRQSLVIAVINLLDDDRDLESRKDEIESNPGNVAAGDLRIALHDLRAREAAWIGGRAPANFL